jgi:hypothetical protein
MGNSHKNLLLRNLGTFWLKIEQFWPFEEISIFSNGCNLGYRTALTDSILKGDYPRMEIHIKIFSSETTRPIATKLLWNDPWMAPSKIVSGDSDF